MASHALSDRSITRGWRAAEARTGRSRVQMWRDVRAGKFPAPIELGPNSIGFYTDELDRWIATRPRRFYGAEHSVAAEMLVHLVST